VARALPQKSEPHKARLLATPCRLSACEPVTEPVHVQCLPAEQANLDLGGICGTVLVQQVAEIEDAGCYGRFSFQCPEPFALARPAAVQVPALPEYVRAELATEKMRDQMPPVRQRAVGIGRQRKSALVGKIALADCGWCYGPGGQCAILLLCPHELQLADRGEHRGHMPMRQAAADLGHALQPRRGQLHPGGTSG
jgi:hypothetical protein